MTTATQYKIMVWSDLVLRNIFPSLKGTDGRCIDSRGMNKLIGPQTIKPYHQCNPILPTAYINHNKQVLLLLVTTAYLAHNSCLIGLFG